jgi:NADPH-dependent glutamate synthase beta subunit-like oxidoreductase
MFNTAPVEVLSDGNGHVTGLKLARTQVIGGKVQTIAGSEFVLPCDMVIKAIGEQKQVNVLKQLFPSLQLDARGVVINNRETGQTNIAKIFTGGDCANGGREVVNAVAEGKKAARGIHAFFAGHNVTGPVQPSRLGVKGSAFGSGFDKPIRVTELEQEYLRTTGKLSATESLGK